jgi:isorenieratene synthase
MQQSIDNDLPVIVIGGGLAGLTAAAHLIERGVPTLLMDADRLWPGGRLSGGDPDSFEQAGRVWHFPSEHGVHGVWGGYGNLRATLERFTTTRLQPSTGEEWINRWGRQVRVVEAGQLVRGGWIPAPFHYLSLLFRPGFWRAITPLDFLSLPGFLFSVLWTLGLDPLREEVALDGLMLNDYFRGWTPNLRATFEGLAINLLAAPREDITLTGTIAALRFYTMLRRDSWAMHFFPSNAHDCVIQPLLDRIREGGGLTLLGAEAQRLERMPDGGWRVVAEDSTRGGRRSAEAAQIILATHAPGAERLLLDSPDTAQAAGAIRFPGAVRNATVRLWFSAAPRPGTAGGMFTGDFLPDNFFWLHRLFDEFREWHSATGGSAIEMHLYANDDLLENQSDNVLLIRCMDEVQRAFPEVRGHFLHGSVRRNSRVQTRFRVPTADCLHLHTPWDNVLACGDWIAYDSPSFWMERSCTTALAAANEILITRGLEPYPIYQPPPPELLARGLQVLARGFRKTIGRALLKSARALRRR